MVATWQSIPVVGTYYSGSAIERIHYSLRLFVRPGYEHVPAPEREKLIGAVSEGHVLGSLPTVPGKPPGLWRVRSQHCR